MQYSISEVAKKLNIPVSTIRYYEKLGMLPPITRHSGIRVFSERDLCVLKKYTYFKANENAFKRHQVFLLFIFLWR